ncbi:MAG: AsmA-like C-terminal region-containing protein, partial [Flavobacteriaceae bacterium]
FKENKAVLNRLPLVFDGYIILREDEQEMDLKFSTIASDFKNFLALIPEKYSKDISQLRTRGNFDLVGHFDGVLNENSIPEFRIQMNAQDASFQYPELPKKVEHIYIDALVENNSGKSEDTSLKIENAAFQIDEDVFQIQAVITEIMGKMEVKSYAKGSINLDKLSQAYPVPASADLSGRLLGDVNIEFTLADIENQNYQQIALDGELDVTGLNYSFESLPNPLKVHTLKAELGPKHIEIKEVAGITGSTDFSAVGRLENTLGFLFNEEVLKGNFEMKSNSFVIADLFVEGSTNDSETEEEESFKIPTYLDLNLNALVGKAVYDNVVMYDLAGNLRIKDEVITFSEISSRMLDGRLVFDGLVSTKNEKPSFRMTLDMSRLNIGSTFESIELMQLLSPAAKALDGRFNTKMALSGNLTNQMDLDLNSISGDVLAEILRAKISTDRAPVTRLLDNTLGIVAFNKLDLEGLKTAFSFENGQVQLKPFKIKYEDIVLTLSGGHNFANALDYELNMDVPAKYLGDDVNKLLAGIGDESLEDVTVPVIAKIGGSYNEPEIKTDLKAQAKAVTSQLVEVQKQKYLNQGKKEVNKLIGNVLAGNKEDGIDADTDNNSVKTADILEKTLQNSTDSLNTISGKESDDKVIEETAKGILGGLLKSKSITAKDTIN